MAGWGSEATFGSLTNYFFWIPLIMPYFGKSSNLRATIGFSCTKQINIGIRIAGGIVGGAIYSFMISVHHKPSVTEVTELKSLSWDTLHADMGHDKTVQTNLLELILLYGILAKALIYILGIMIFTEN